jgi:RPA family protein
VQIVDQKAVEMFTAETAKRTVERIILLKKAILDGNGSDDLKMVIAAYNPNIEDLKNMVRVAIGKIPPNTNSQTMTNGDGGGVKTQPPALWQILRI